jgi:large subunit ribosomal protein L31
VRRSAFYTHYGCYASSQSHDSLARTKNHGSRGKLHKKKRVAKKNSNRYDYTLRTSLEYFFCTDLKEEEMREGIHPAYNEITVKCLCGNTFQTRSTLKEINTEICSACHPFFTGKQKLMDTAGRVERFKKRYGQI